MFIGIDNTETKQVRLGTITYTIGVVPLGKFEQLTAELDDARRPWNRHLQVHRRDFDGRPQVDVVAVSACAECDRLFVQSNLQAAPACRELVRWGLRGWDGPNPPPTEVVAFAGASYTVLTSATVERLARVEGGLLVRLLAEQIRAANSLSEREALGFTSPSGDASGRIGSTRTAPASNSATTPS